MKRPIIKALTTVTFAAALLQSAPAIGSDPTTDVTELVLYGIDADTHELLRYVFDTDTFARIGVVLDQNGYAIDHPECLTYVPSGPNKGFYSSPTGKDETGGPRHVLAKIDGMTGDAFMYSNVFTYKGLRGMTTVPDGSGGWIILAVAANNKDAKLVALDPVTGAQALVSDIDDDIGKFQGLATHPTDPDKLYIMTDSKLAELDIASGQVNEMVDHSAWARTEALELMMGENGAAIVIPGVDPDWTQQGALFGFSDTLNMMLVYHPGGSDFAEYTCSFVTVDCEGLVFMTRNQDPYGKITVEAHD